MTGILPTYSDALGADSLPASGRAHEYGRAAIAADAQIVTTSRQLRHDLVTFDPSRTRAGRIGPHVHGRPQVATAEATQQRQLTMKYAGGLVRHLGLQMYSGFVPAISELISNAWDADAANVWVTAPLGEQITADSEVHVQDDGIGMTFDDVNDAYLVLGRDRRRGSGAHTPSGRRVMGRKGIGKLAGFGIATLMEVTTVKNGHLTKFRMDYEKIVEGTDNFGHDYKPELLEDRSVSADDEIQQGTLVVLKRLQANRAVNEDSFKRSLRRRFAVLGQQFRVRVNNEEEALEPDQQAFQFRFPDEGVAHEEIPGVGQVSWWVGFTEVPIQHEEARGISVLAHGKLVQAPFFFDLSGGAFGQHGMQYMTGEVVADSLDEAKDLIATDRASVMWEDPTAKPLLEWGERKVRELLRTWSELRAKENEEKIKRVLPELTNIDRLPERARRELTSAVRALGAIDTIDEDRLRELVGYLVRAYDNDNFFELVKRLSDASAEEVDGLLHVFAEWDVQEAVSMAWVVRGRVEIIRTFERMIDERVPEKPDMQDYLREHPWLIDPAYDVMRHERTLDKLIGDDLSIDIENDEGRRRVDFFCLADTSRAVVVEVKRPGNDLTKDDIRQLQDYVMALRRANDNVTDADKKMSVSGILIGHAIRGDDRNYFESAAKDGMVTRTWVRLLQDAERLHQAYLEKVRDRAPSDPRLENMDDNEDEASSTTSDDGTVGDE